MATVGTNSNQNFSPILTNELLEKVVKPGQYLGNEWGAYHRHWDSAEVHLAFAFPDLYELGMSNFGQRILYQIVNNNQRFLADRSYAPATDMEELLRARNLPLWGLESRRALKDFELLGFSLAYELTYTNVLNMLELSHIPVLRCERQDIFPLVFAGGPSTVNPEPMADFMDFFLIGDGEVVLPAIMELIAEFKKDPKSTREDLLLCLAQRVPGVYVPGLYQQTPESAVVTPTRADIPTRVERQIVPLTDENQPTAGLVPYLSLVHDRQVLEVRRGCDRGCRFCQPGYTFLPVRERSTEDLLKLSKQVLDNSGQTEYSMLSLCVSDYTSLQESMHALNLENISRRASLSFPSQRADRMNLDIAEELKVVRKSGITLAPEAGSERLRAVINKGLNHEQIISAIESAYKSGWSAVKLYFMLGLPTETDEDLAGIIAILKEATNHCKAIRNQNPLQYRRQIEFTCTLSNTVPKPFTPFQWYGQINLAETKRRQRVIKDKLKESGLRNVNINFTNPATSMLEAVISRGDRTIGKLIYSAWRKGASFDAWDEHFKVELWEQAAAELGLSLEDLACTAREVGSKQPWDIIHVGLMDWWLVAEWNKAMTASQTAPCTENTCHACGICTELDTTHLLAKPKEGQSKRNPFVKELAAHKQDDSHPSLFFMNPPPPPPNQVVKKLRFELTKVGELRFISHLDMQHLLARAARRAKLNIAFTEGFNPSPKLSLAISLPIFQESLAEIAEVEMADEVSPDDFLQRMNAQLPPEIQLSRVKIITSSKLSLSSLVGRASYRAHPAQITVAGAPFEPNEFVQSQMKAKIADILAQTSLVVEIPSKDKPGEFATKDIRSGIYSLKMGQDQTLSVELLLATGSKLHVKPSDILSILNPEIIWRVTRTGLTTLEGVPLFDLP